MNRRDTTATARTKGSPPKPGAVSRTWRKLSELFGRQIWIAETEELTPWQRRRYRVARVLIATVDGWRQQRLPFRAAALTYFSVLSLVPALAFAFAVLKGLGAYRMFVEGTLRPYMQSTFYDNPQLLRAFDEVLHFVGQTGVSSLGVAGLLFLVYTTIGLLSNVEIALNDIWGVKQERSLLRQVTDYVTMVVTTPLFVLIAVAFGSAAHSSGVIEFLRTSLHLGVVIDFAVRFASVAVASMAVFVLFVVMPNTRVAPVSALLGGTIAGVLWQAALALQINAQSSLARYNALYSGFAALPIFLLWLYVSWLVVLIGALLAASHQNERRLVQQHRLAAADQELRERIAASIAARVARSFLVGRPRWTGPTLATEMGVPGELVEQAVDALVAHGILARTNDRPHPGVIPARDLADTHLSDVLRAMRTETRPDRRREDLRSRLGTSVVDLVDALEEHAQRSPDNLSLDALGRRAPEPHRVPDEESRPATVERSAMADAKETPAEA